MTDSARVVIPFALVGADQNPNAAHLAHNEQQAAYARGAAATFASLRRWNPDLTLTWFTNGPVHPVLQPTIDACGVEVVTHDFTHEPPEGFMRAFVGCLFMLDALPAFAGENVLYLDPDVLCIRSLHSMLTSAGDQIGALPMHFPPDEEVNGVTPDQARALNAELNDAPFGGFIGGEVLWLPGDRASTFSGQIDRAFSRQLELFAEGQPHFQTEEHLFSSVLSATPWFDLDPFIQRIWTTSRYRTVSGHEDRLSLWHLPSEKDRGFKALFPAIEDRSSWFWTASHKEFIDRCGRIMSLHHRAPKKLARDALGTAANVADRVKARVTKA